ncbi:MAG TPA: hypothetical protein VKA85_11120 [Candidatus Limnocylindrales bacterium]|nr:hypothetical protein [Candidatus Limnocylindrales bacterium]
MNRSSADQGASAPGTTVTLAPRTAAPPDVPNLTPERRRNPHLRAVVDGIVRAAGERAEPDQPKPVRARSRSAPDPKVELREQLRRLEQIRPRGTALTAVSRRDPHGWHAVLNGPGYGATGIGDTPPAAIAHLVYLLGGGE